jgi:pyruvate phosphate dikinase-like enzyme
LDLKDLLSNEHSFKTLVDTQFDVYHELMALKIQEILLVANPYDAYIMQEDGSLASKIINEYQGLNLSRPPRLTHAASGKEALNLLEQNNYDLVIALPNLKDMSLQALSRAIKRINRTLPVMLLAHNTNSLDAIHEGPAVQSVDQTFVWSGDSDLLLTLVKHAEDRLNVEADTQKAGVRVLILVEDSPLYRSYFLPLIYREIVRQTQSVLKESLNEEHRLLKMRARPKILVAENYERATAIYYKFKPYVFGIVSDTRFPYAGKLTSNAGVQLLGLIKKEIPYLPMLLMSAEPGNRKCAEELNIEFLDKNTPQLSEEIRKFFLNYLGFGDFVFRSSTGKEIGRATNLRELETLLPTIPEEPIIYNASRNRFSNWLMARSEVGMASALNRIQASSFSDGLKLKEFLISSIRYLRKSRHQGVVAQFSAKHFEPGISDFVKIGHGSLGGKARGVAFFSNLLRENTARFEKYSNIKIAVPETLVITTDMFDQFLEGFHTKGYQIEGLNDQEISKLFLSVDLPKDLLKKLQVFLSKVRCPLAVRSSSILEDAHFQPFSGLYQTYMLPNNHPSISICLQQLADAIKLVYASAFHKDPLTFTRNTAHFARRESMAILIQRLVGQTFGDYYYPTFSGIAQSWNYYPFSRIKPKDGVAFIGLGIGTFFQAGNSPVRFCPRYPKILPQFSSVSDILENAQSRFYALELKAPQKGGLPETCLAVRDVFDAQEEGPVQYLSSTFIPEENRIRDTAVISGPKVLTFASILKHNRFPLPELIADLLVLGEEGLGCDVDFEFCANLYPTSGKQNKFYILQVRPMAATQTHMDVHVTQKDMEASFCFSHQCLGNGVNNSISDIVYIKHETFQPEATVEIARALHEMNLLFKKTQKKYLLLGPGRWGSADRWLGIPVKWADISEAGAMVEVRNEQLKADPSHGSHFFHQMTGRGLHYITVTENEEDFIDWTWLKSHPAVHETQYLRHVSLTTPFVIKVDGRHGRCAMIPQHV